MHALLRQLLSTSRRRRLFPEPGRCLVAVSGGPDSVALLHALADLGESLGLELLVAHVDHGLRGAEATADAVLVGETAGRLGLPAEFGLRQVAPAPGESLEEAARHVRYAFLGETAARHAARYIAIGHTADDQAETLLMRLLRGAGPCGLKAMTPLSPRAGAAVVRPLLDTRRDLVRDYLSERGLPFRLDRTNRDLRLMRNRTRHVLMPLLASEFNPGVVATLGRTAAVMNEVDAYFTRWAERSLDGDGVAVSGHPNGPAGALQAGAPGPPFLPHPARLVLDIRRLNSYDRVLRRYLLRQAILRLRGDLRGIGFDHVAALLSLAGPGGRTGRTELPGGLIGIREGTELSLWASDPGEARAIPFTPLPLDGQVDLPECGLRIETRLVKLPESAADKGVSDAPGSDVRGAGGAAAASAFALTPGEGEDPGRAVFDRAQLRAPLAVRSRRAGDRIVPFGLEAAKKVKDLLIAARVPRRLRPAVPLLVDGAGEPAERILWVAGCRRSAHAPVGPGTSQVVEVRVSSTTS